MTSLTCKIHKINKTKEQTKQKYVDTENRVGVTRREGRL